MDFLHFLGIGMRLQMEAADLDLVGLCGLQDAQFRDIQGRHCVKSWETHGVHSGGNTAPVGLHLVHVTQDSGLSLRGGGAPL